jgi:chemotaxis protein MotC
MARWPLLASTALALVAASAARAEGPAPAASPAIATPQGAPLDFIVRMLGGKTLSEPQPVVPAAPIVQVVPAAAAPVAKPATAAAVPAVRSPAATPAPAATAAVGAPMALVPEVAAPVKVLPAAPRRIVTANVPMPRLRPEYHPAALAALSPAPPGAIDHDITGSVDTPSSVPTPAEPPPAAPTVAAAPAPTPATVARPPAAAPVPAPIIAESDGLLGDSNSFDLNRPDDLAPDAPVPEGIRTPPPAAADALMAAGGKGTAEVEPGVPYELVRSLQLLQDRMADGDVEALTAQRPLRVEIDRTFASAPADVWSNPRNAEAAITYVLSGGSPDILKRLAALDPKPPVDEKLLAGVLAYAGGDAKTAAPLLADVNLSALPPSMAGQVAIAQSALVVQGDPAKAMKLLAYARLLAPGTLVEEAAIRRQLFVADQQRDEDAVQSLARQYLDRFRRSVYAGNFRTRFAAALSHMRSIDSEEKFSRLDDMLAMVEPDARCELYLTVALASTINNRLVAARLAAERSSTLALAGSVQDLRARLYHAAALAALPKLADKAAADLDGVRREGLPAADQPLFDMVAMTVKGVQSGTDRASIKVATAEPLGDAPAADPVLARAQKALTDTDPLLGITPPPAPAAADAAPTPVASNASGPTTPAPTTTASAAQ